MDQTKWHDYNGEIVYDIFGSATQTVMFTSKRFIFVTRGLLNLFNRGKHYSALAKEEGQGGLIQAVGFFAGITGTQTEADYKDLSPTQMLASSNKSFEIKHEDVKKVRYKIDDTYYGDLTTSSNLLSNYVKIYTFGQGTHRFECSCTEEKIELFTFVFGDKFKKKIF